MKRLFIKIFACLALALVIFSCSKERSILQVQNRNFLDQIDLQQNLMFTFNNDLVDDSLLDQWIEEDYLKIEPPVRGRFKWTAKNELVFSPDYRFSPSTEYSITLTDKLIAKVQDMSLPEEISFRFHTPFLNIQNTGLFWSRKETNRSVIELRTNINFNYKVDPVEVKKLMAVFIAGKEMPYELLSSSHGETVQIGIAQGDAEFDEKDLKISIKPGLKCLESEFVSKQPIVTSSLVPSKDKFRIVQASGVSDDDDPYIHVVTNQELYDGNIAKYIKVSPSVSFKVEPVTSGFYLKGAFRTGEAYDVTISKNLKGIFGGSLEKDFEQTVFFGEQKPFLSFSSKRGTYLSGKGEKNVALKIINVPTIQVSLYKIYANNIVHFLGGGSDYDYYDYEEDYYYDDYDRYRYSSFDGQGDMIFSKTYQTKSLSKSGGESLINLDFKDINEFKGIYVLKVASDDERYVSCSKILSISDVGLIVKTSGDDISVFANSILTTNPLEGVEVTLVSHNNQSVLKGNTDKEGILKFEGVSKKAPGFRIKMLTSRLGEDFNYMDLRQTTVNTSQFDVGGARNNPAGYEAYTYGERNIYRPGETINLNTIIRNSEWQPLPDAPVKVRLLLPNGKEFAAKQGKLSKQGGFESSFQLPPASVTGTYIAEVYSGNDVLLNSYHISVEEFIPDRIKINSKVLKEHVTLKEAVEVEAQALNLFGPPAPNRNYEAEFVLTRKYFSPKDFDGYNFTPSSNSISFTNDVREGKTDQQGKFTESFNVPESYINNGILDGKVYLTVFDETGRPVHSVKRFEVATQDVMYGMHYIDYYVGTNEPLKVPLAAVTPQGKAVAAQCQVKVVKYDWQTVLVRNNYGGYRYVSQKKETVFEDKVISINGKNNSFSFTPVQSGEYEVRVSKPGVDQYVSNSFYAYGWGTTTNASFEVNTDGKIDIETDKSKYEVGDNARILFKTPFKGRMLVTVERDKIFEQFFVTTDGRAASLDIPVKEEYLPNVYVTATLLKPSGETSIPLTVAHGFAPLTAEKKENRLPVTIKVPEKSRSRTKQNILITSRPESDIELTVAIVDEGILQLKGFATPDPYSYFYRKRALEVVSHDLYPQVLPDLKSKSSVAGDGYDLEKRVNPLTNKRVKLVSFWSGTIKTNSNGEATYTVDIPQFSGDLRIMAVAHKGKAFGATSINMKVADPVVVSTGLPRFLSPMDTVIVPVTMTNTTGKSAPAVASVSVSGPLQVVGSASQNVTLNPNEEARVEFKVIALANMGEGKISAEVKAMNENFREVLDITVRPASSLLKTSGYGTVADGKSNTFSLDNDYIPSSVDAELIISKSPLVQFKDNLDYLIGYPHGCVEQTVSRAFPQVYLKDIMKNMGIKSKSNQNPEYYVQEGIRKLESMQLYNGGLSYWQGSYDPSWWGSVYATHFLQESKKAGYDVKNDVLERLYGYLQQKIKGKDYHWYYYYDQSGAYKKKEIAPREIFYSLYILAKVGKQDMSVMNYYKTNYNLLSLDSRYLLAMTYYLLGDQASYRVLLPTRFEGETSAKSSGGSFYSPVRDLGLALNTMIDVDPKNGQIPVLANHLTKTMRAEKYLSTQENAFAMLALGKLAKSSEAAPAKATVMADGKKIATFEGKDLIIRNNIAGKDIKIVPEGSGNLYYFWSVEGLSSTGEVKEEDNFIRVRRTFYDRNGRQITGNTFNQNDLVVVKLTVQTTDNSSVENVVITDLLPAGFEIENPRLSETADMPWIKNNSNPQHFDIRDDRINLFTTINGRPKEFYYLVRAVSPGTFRIGPASADAMYNGDYHSYNGAGLIRVLQ